MIVLLYFGMGYNAQMRGELTQQRVSNGCQAEMALAVCA